MSFKRRNFLKAGGSTIASMLISPGILGEMNKKPRGEFLHTPLCDLLNIRYPIIQSGMGGIAGPELAAQVSESGGLGIIAGTFLTPEELRNRIKKVRQLTNKPFGVNLMLHQDLLSPVDIKNIPDSLVKSVQDQLNKFRTKLGIPNQHTLTAAVPDYLDQAFEIILEENVPVWSIGLGKPSRDQVNRCHDKGIKIITMIATAEDAREVSKLGVDVIVAQGGEAGGHRSTDTKKASREHAVIGTMVLVPEVVDAVKQPVVAAGGITDGRSMVAALALGAVGVLIGTRFIASRESIASDVHKQAVLKSGSNETTITDKHSGAYARVIRNSFTEEYEKSNTPVLPPWVQIFAVRDIHRAAIEKNDPEYFGLWAGQVTGRIQNIPSASEIVRTIVHEAERAINTLKNISN